nr:Hypothetical protein [Providencia alcalifaciens]
MTKSSGHSLNVNTIYYDHLHIEYTTVNQQRKTTCHLNAAGNDF